MFSGKRHLKYKSVWEWREKENIPDKLYEHPNQAQADRWLTEYAELRQHLYDQHLKTLNEEEQRLISEGLHASFSHDRAEQAKPYIDSLCEELDNKGFEYESVILGFYHGNRIILMVAVHPRLGEVWKANDWLHRGFEVMYRHLSEDELDES